MDIGRCGPRLAFPPEREEPTEDRELSAGRGKYLDESIRILLVEDEIPILTIFEKLLALKGWQIQAVDNAPDAIGLWEEGSFDLIFMDLQMPSLNGLEATRIIRRLEREKGRDHIPIIALTAWCRPEDRLFCMEAGMDDYLPKPIRKEDLYAMVEKHLGGG